MLTSLTLDDVELILASLRQTQTQYLRAEFFTVELRDRALHEVAVVIAKMEEAHRQLSVSSAHPPE